MLYGKYIRTSFSDTTAPLLQDERFLSVHKSFVVNLEKAKEFQKDGLIMDNGAFIPVSRLKYSQVKKKYFSYLHGDLK